ncbi:MAG: hypothetical protein JWO52_4126 [Gammaproteobacteria bacterium]|nr:hypothetical protein [Gammaproteobacteria bacterium]
MNEPVITINGQRCTEAQAVTIRCAIENLASDLHDSGLGEDEHGREMTRLYLQRIAEIRVLVFGRNAVQRT